ncbi:UNVERIFIED_CONTAM: hypothetical protein Slati_1342400 [Sesamum latifolium]|uniref:Uncharacterized protein n=1 Tax=Sesamum latifolium TaxID=2727402 RepID=A0AAW2XI15_9LAMI
MREFNQCLIEAGVDTPPMQGHWFSWYSSSEGAKSLWRRLECALVNDAWLGRWPDSHYICSASMTSDHSPLILGKDRHFQNNGSLFRFDNFLLHTWFSGGSEQDLEAIYS